MLIYIERSLECALFYCEAAKKRWEPERSVGGNTRRSTNW